MKQKYLLSRQLGIPLTKAGRQRKAGKAMGCCIPIAFLLIGCGFIIIKIVHSAF
jgi:hypothetical protein